MQYRIIGDTMPAVEVLFDAPGESMYTQSGGMAWMSDGIFMDSNMRGGLGKSIGRMFSGESLFMATYKAERAGSMVTFASTVAGEVLPVDVGANGGMICQKGAFLCLKNETIIYMSPSASCSSPIRSENGYGIFSAYWKGCSFRSPWYSRCAENLQDRSSCVRDME